MSDIGATDRSDERGQRSESKYAHDDHVLLLVRIRSVLFYAAISRPGTDLR